LSIVNHVVQNRQGVQAVRKISHKSSFMNGECRDSNEPHPHRRHFKIMKIHENRSEFNRLEQHASSSCIPVRVVKCCLLYSMQFKLKAIDLNAIKSIRKVVFALMAMTCEFRHVKPQCGQPSAPGQARQQDAIDVGGCERG